MAADVEIGAIVVVIKREVNGNFTQSARFGGRFFLRESQPLAAAVAMSQ
jgi:hypothetical protein